MTAGSHLDTPGHRAVPRRDDETPPQSPSPGIAVRTPDRPDHDTRAVRVFGGLVRITLGFTFLWAFLDKLVGLGHETPSEEAWVSGGSPTAGFLEFASTGPFAGFYQSFVGAAWADWLFMLGLLAIGLSLVVGVFMGLAAGAGALMLVLMWTAVLPPANNPVIDDHIIYALTLGLLAAAGAGRWLGAGRAWERTRLVRAVPALR